MNGLWTRNSNGTYTAQKGDTLWGLYGASWQEKSGFTRDLATLQIGETVGYANNTIISISGGIVPQRQSSEITGLQTYYNQKELPIGQSLADAPQLFTSVGGGVSFGIGTVGGNTTVTTTGYSNSTSINVTGDIGISVPGLYGSVMIGINFPGNFGSQQNNISTTISGNITISENGITSIGVGLTTNFGFNLNTGDIGINYNLFKGEFNTNSGDSNISAPFIMGDKLE